MRPLLTVCLLLCASPPILVGDDGPTDANSAVDRAIQANAEAFVKAFDAGDAKAVAALYSEDGRLSVDGETIATGRDEIEKSYAEFFASHAGAEIVVTIDSIKLLGPNVAVEKGTSRITTGDDPVEDAYTLVHVKRGETWLTTSADVVGRPIAANVDWKEEIGFLVGTWVTKEEDWSVETTFEWVAGGNFLKRTFEVRNGDEVESSGVQVIGWDPLAGSITSWTFGSDGGHGRGWWTPDGNSWLVEATGTTATGDELRATNVLTRLGDGAFRWQSTERSVNGVPVDDTVSVRVTRKK